MLKIAKKCHKNASNSSAKIIFPVYLEDLRGEGGAASIGS